MSELQTFGNTFEQILFYGQDPFVLDVYRNEIEKKQTLKEIANATGIQDLQVLGTFMEQGLTRMLIMTIKLTPLVLVAWADNKLDTAEKIAF